MRRSVLQLARCWLLLAAAPALARAQSLPAGSGSGAAARFSVPPDVIAAALTTPGLPVFAENIRLAAPLSATAPAPALRVLAAEPRPDGSLRLRVACRNAAECVPVFVSLRNVDSAAFLAAWHAGRATAERSAGVAVGAQVLLELADRQMRIQLRGVAIDTGAPGTEVRVSSLDRKHTWRGIVVDAGTVKGGVE